MADKVGDFLDRGWKRGLVALEWCIQAKMGYDRLRGGCVGTETCEGEEGRLLWEASFRFVSFGWVKWVGPE